MSSGIRCQNSHWILPLLSLCLSSSFPLPGKTQKKEINLHQDWKQERVTGVTTLGYAFDIHAPFFLLKSTLIFAEVSNLHPCSPWTTVLGMDPNPSLRERWEYSKQYHPYYHSNWFSNTSLNQSALSTALNISACWEKNMWLNWGQEKFLNGLLYMDVGSFEIQISKEVPSFLL